MLSIGRTVIRDFNPIYGIGYRREMDLGPTFYGMGGCMGLDLWGEERNQGEVFPPGRTHDVPDGRLQ
jgi:hypothetical protein